MSDESAETQISNEQLLSDAITSLRGDSQTDAALLDILFEHVVTLDPADTAVSDARAKIEELAGERSERHEDDLPNHD